MEQSRTFAKRLIALDGLRGIAIVLVLFNHFLPNLNYAPSRIMQWTSNLAQSGWIGVDFFFVLSGFLITGILLDAKGSRHYFKNFYMRRVLRIFPLYFGSLIVVFVLLPFFGVLRSTDLGNVWTMQGWNWTYCTNIGMLLDDGSGFYCEYVCFAHFWSLAVEEHFYLIWPALIFLTPARYLKGMCLACIVVALTTRFVAVVLFDAPHVFFFLTPCRLDNLALGGILAACWKDGTLARWQTRIYAVGGALAALMIIGFFYWRGLPAQAWCNHLVGYSIYGGFFAAVLVMALAAKPGSFIEAMFGNATLVFFGKYSYGLYVIHGLLSPVLTDWLPVDTWIATFNSVILGTVTCTLTRIGVVIVLAMASWHLFEKQFLKLKRYFEYHPVSAQGLHNRKLTLAHSIGEKSNLHSVVQSHT